MFALLHMSAADAAIACWRGKFEYGLWHPVTAIPLADTDGNPATIADSAWAPLIGTPPYPDHPSGLSCLTGATSGVLSALFGDIDLTLTSPVTGTTRRYPTADALDEEVIDARVWSGIHFRKADVDGVRLGHEVAEHALRQAFWGDDPEDGR